MQFLGDFFYFLLTVISVQVLAASRIRLYTALWIAYSLVEFAAGTYFILEQKLALRSLAIAHLASSVIALAIFFWPAIGSIWKAHRNNFRLAELAFFFGLTFLILQALLLRADADLLFRFSTAAIYTVLVVFMAWKYRTEHWNTRWINFVLSLSKKDPPSS